MSRKDWKLEPKIRIGLTKTQFVFVPTVIYYPEEHRIPYYPAFTACWLWFYFRFGVWTHKG